jgi:hypothetical protein
MTHWTSRYLRQGREAQLCQHRCLRRLSGLHPVVVSASLSAVPETESVLVLCRFYAKKILVTSLQKVFARL